MPGPQFLSVHCHYYQPPRGNPFSSRPLIEADAAPHPNWNARITAECYEPNGAIGNFSAVSFNLGETLASWLAEHAPQTYQYFLKADADNVSRFGEGNAVAQPMHHTILPLSRRRDKVTQVRWGKAFFKHRFGRQSAGIWLPEMACDLETLEVLIEQGIEWTILTERQVIGKPAGAGPYWIRLPGGQRIKVFVRDEGLSNDIAFNLGHFGGAGRWARQVLVPRKRDAGPLTLIATDGETFGHHWPGEEQFLHWLMTYEARAAGYETTTLGRYLKQVEPHAEVELCENTSWSCGHGLARWSTGCSCTPGDSTWKGALRRALDNLRAEVDTIYLREAHNLDIGDPAELRDAYIRVVLGIVPREQFLKEQEIDLPADRGERLLKLVEAQYYRQVMYASCAFFYPELDALSTRYGIANAANTIRLTREATGEDLTHDFRRDLGIAAGPARKSGEMLTGAEIFDELAGELI